MGDQSHWYCDVNGEQETEEVVIDQRAADYAAQILLVLFATHLGIDIYKANHGG